MGKTVVDEDLRWTVHINGDPAQKELYELEKRNKSLKESTKLLKQEKAALEAQGKKNSQAYKDLSAKITANNKEVKENSSRMRDLQKEIGVTGLTLRQLGQRASFLRLQLATMLPKDPGRSKLKQELAEVNAQIQKLSFRAKTAETSISRLANGFNKYAALGASAIATGTGLVISMQKLIDFNGKLSDAQSNVQKTTNLSKKEVKELTREFGLLKTRTARIELLKLAEEAGRLGIEGKADVMSFVETANLIKLALGDDLSETQIREVGKIAKIYKVGERNNISFAESFESVGSAINEVSASGSAQADFLVDFLKRTGGISDIANISAQDMIGLAAAFDEAGQSQEISATAINKSFGSMAKEVTKFSKIAGVAPKEFSKILREDANEALILFLEGLKRGNPTLEEMEERLEGIELGGTRGKQALSALAANVDNLREKQELANKALLENESLSKEAKLREENFAALLEKIQRRIRGLFASEVVVEGLKNFMEWFGKFIGAVEDGDGKVTRFRNRLVNFLKTVIVITAAILSYKAALQLATLWTNNAWKATRLYNIIQKVTAASTATLRGATLLLQAAYFLVTGNIKKATVAMRAFSIATKLSPIGLVVGLIGAAATAYAVFSESAEEAATKQSLLNDAQKEAEKQTVATKKELELLLEVAKNEKLSTEQRQEAIDKLNETIPEYNNNLTIEKAKLTETKTALDNYIKSLEQSALTKALLDRIEKKAIEKFDAENSSIEENVKWYQTLWNAVKSGGQAHAFAASQSKTGTQNRKENVEAIQDEIDKLGELYAKQLEENPSGGITGGDDNTGFAGNSGGSDKGKGKGRKGSSRIDEAKREAASLLQLERETEDRRIAQIEDAFIREMAQNEANHQRRLQDLQIKSDDVLQLYDKALKSGDTDLASIYLSQYHELYDQIDLLDKDFYNDQLETIKSGKQAQFTEQQEAFEREKKVRQTEFLAQINDLKTLEEAKLALRETNSTKELESIKSLEDAKKALNDEFKAEELEKEAAHLEKLIKQFNDFLLADNFKGFDLSLLTPEQKENFEQQIDEIKLKVQELKNAKNNLQQPSSDEEDTGIDLGEAGKLDILGFTAEDWLKTFENLETTQDYIGAASMAVQGFMNAWSMYHDYVSQAEEREYNNYARGIEQRKAKQKSLYDAGYLNKRQYDNAVKKLDEEADKQKAELEYKQAKRKWQMDLTNAIVNTALGVTQALGSSPPPANFILAALVGIMGGLQIAQISKNKPVRGYESGYYGNFSKIRREQDGKLFSADFGGESRSGVVDKPTVFMAGEGGKNFPELIISGPDLKQLDPTLKQSLYQELGKIKGFEAGFYNNVPRQSRSFEDTESIENDRHLLAAALNRNSEIMELLYEKGVVAYMSKDLENIKNFRDEIKTLETIERKSTILG